MNIPWYQIETFIWIHKCKLINEYSKKENILTTELRVIADALSNIKELQTRQDHAENAISHIKIGLDYIRFVYIFIFIVETIPWRWDVM